MGEAKGEAKGVGEGKGVGKGVGEGADRSHSSSFCIFIDSTRRIFSS